MFQSAQNRLKHVAPKYILRIMNYTIFFSWQSERRDISNHIRAMLEKCIKELSLDLIVNLTITDADSNNRGSYNINTAVIRGIEAADIVVADLTPTSHRDDGRANPNANALYEYAYSCAVKGFENVLAIADISKDSIKDMPFDWNHNSIVAFNGITDDSFSASLKVALSKILSAKILPVLRISTTEFVANRIAAAFPGVRGLKSYSDPHEIKLHLEAFFKHPILFGESTDADGSSEPIWWFRGGSTEAITSFRVLKNGIYLIGWNEFKIKSITVYSDSSRYYSEYIYVETEPLKPVMTEMSEDKIKQITCDLGYCDEEYAVVRVGEFEKEITREEYDDGYAEVNGEIVPIRGKAQLRCRFLSPYNFIIAAKFSSINNTECDIRTQNVFDEIFKGTASVEDLHKIIVSLPKPQFCGRNS